jgi:hypothetical protein
MTGAANFSGAPGAIGWFWVSNIGMSERGQRHVSALVQHQEALLAAARSLLGVDSQRDLRRETFTADAGGGIPVAWQSW